MQIYQTKYLFSDNCYAIFYTRRNDIGGDKVSTDTHRQ